MAKDSLMRRRCFSFAPVFMLMLLVGVFGFPKEMKYKFTHLLPASRGTRLLYTRKASPLICSIVCFHERNCKAFNYFPSSGTCEILSNTYKYIRETGSEMYVPDATYIYNKMTIGGCSNCFSGMFPGKWDFDCQGNGFLVGIGTNQEQTYNIDYLNCMKITTISLDYENHGFVLTNPSADCTSALGKTAVPVGIWSDDIYFSNPSNFAILCRPVLSGQQVDLDSCFVPDVTPSTKKFPDGITLIANFMICPSEALPVGLHLSSEGQWLLKCCSFANF